MGVLIDNKVFVCLSAFIPVPEPHRNTFNILRQGMYILYLSHANLYGQGQYKHNEHWLPMNQLGLFTLERDVNNNVPVPEPHANTFYIPIYRM